MTNVNDAIARFKQRAAPTTDLTTALSQLPLEEENFILNETLRQYGIEPSGSREDRLQQLQDQLGNESYE